MRAAPLLPPGLPTYEQFFLLLYPFMMRPLFEGVSFSLLLSPYVLHMYFAAAQFEAGRYGFICDFLKLRAAQWQRAFYLLSERSD